MSVLIKINQNFQKLTERFPWLAHLVATVKRYNQCRGNFYAAGLTYYSIFAILPGLMLIFAAIGFVFVFNPGALRDLYDALPGSLSNNKQVRDLIWSAISSRKTIGYVGIILAAYTGLNYITNLRVALTAMWKQDFITRKGIKAKLNDLLIFLGLFLAVILVLLGLIFSQSLEKTTLLNQVDQINPSLYSWGLKTISYLLSFLIIWLVFFLILGFVPLVKVSWRQSILVSLVATGIYLIFLVLSVYYLKMVVSGPAGVAFGPIVGLLVFLYVTSRILLLMAAWIATAQDYTSDATS